MSFKKDGERLGVRVTNASNAVASHAQNMPPLGLLKDSYVSFAGTAKLISSFVFATQIVQFLYFLNPNFPASSDLCLYCTVRFMSDLFEKKTTLLVFS